MIVEFKGVSPIKSLYIVDYWVPFPSSEYGGVINVIAETDEECFDILSNSDQFDSNYNDRIMTHIVKAPRFSLTNQDEESHIVDVFLT